MNINLNGRNISITPAISKYVYDKLEKLSKHSDKITQTEVFLSVEKLNHTAKATVHVPGSTLTATATTEDLYAAVDKLSNKLDRQLVAHNRKANDHRLSNKDKKLGENAE